MPLQELKHLSAEAHRDLDLAPHVFILGGIPTVCNRGVFDAAWSLARRVARCSGPTPEDVVDRERRQHRVLFDDNLEAMPIEELGESLEAPGAVVRFNDDLLHLRIALAGVVPMKRMVQY